MWSKKYQSKVEELSPRISCLGAFESTNEDKVVTRFDTTRRGTAPSSQDEATYLPIFKIEKVPCRLQEAGARREPLLI